jgi:hypothetical protein
VLLLVISVRPVLSNTRYGSNLWCVGSSIVTITAAASLSRRRLGVDRQPNGKLWEQESILNHGGSCVVGPLGEFIAEPVREKKGIVYAELGRQELVESRMDFDAVGSYSTPDIL